MNSSILINGLLMLTCAAASPVEDSPVSVGSLYDTRALFAFLRACNTSILDSVWTGTPCSDGNGNGNESSWLGINCINSRVVEIHVEGIGLLCAIDDPLIFARLTELSLVSFKNNSITGTMFDFSSNTKLSTIDLSMNQFSGPISSSLLGLSMLNSLQLNDNEFNGTIPPLNQPGLKLFNVSYNKLVGKIPTTPTLQSFNESSYLSNVNLCGPLSTNPCGLQLGESPPPTANSSNEKPGGKFFSEPTLVRMFIALDVAGLLALIWVMVTLYRRRRRRISANTQEKRDVHDDEDIKEEKFEEEVVEEPKKLVFVKDDNGFDLDKLLRASAKSLGTGSFGASYKVVFDEDDDKEFLVKRLRDVSPMTDGEFANHMSVVNGYEHPNLFPMLGYHYSMSDKLLVYNFAKYDNLYHRIHGRRGESSRIPFLWNSRLSVAKHIARAMEFLHTNTTDPDSVPHGNLKSTNVLLESDDVALVSDYGFLPLISVTVAPKRMAVYKSPEYQHARKIFKKSDVWSFGCLLLELVTREFPAQKGMDGAQLVNWVHRSVREEWTIEVFDREIACQRGAMNGMFKLLQVALWCCEGEIGKRPEMSAAAMEVEGIMPADSDDVDEEESI